MKGGFAATQGNESLIPTPPLPPCASAICGVAPVPAPKPMSESLPVQSTSVLSNASSIRIIRWPTIELARDNLTIVRWTTNTPGGSPVHYGIVHYGTDPNHLIETAKSPIRLNLDHSSTVFRVRLDNLKLQTTYYYSVGSLEASGKNDGLRTSVNRFTTP
jgi:hypothetical protein